MTCSWPISRTRLSRYKHSHVCSESGKGSQHRMSWRQFFTSWCRPEYSMSSNNQICLWDFLCLKIMSQKIISCYSKILLSLPFFNILNDHLKIHVFFIPRAVSWHLWLHLFCSIYNSILKWNKIFFLHLRPISHFKTINWNTWNFGSVGPYSTACQRDLSICPHRNEWPFSSWLCGFGS